MKQSEFYPRMIPIRGTTRQNDRAMQTETGGVKEVRCVSEEEHIKMNAADHAEMIADNENKPTGTAISTAVDEAAANQREADARIAESFGDEGRKIADAIRGVTVHEASVAAPRVSSGAAMVASFESKQASPKESIPSVLQSNVQPPAAAHDPLNDF